MSSVLTQEGVANLVSRFVVATLDYGTRGAGRLGGVSHSTVASWRSWRRKGADPATLPPLLPETVQSLGGYLKVAGDIEVKRAALRLAADRLDGVAGQLRREAATPLVSVGDVAEDAEAESVRPNKVRGKKGSVGTS